MGKVSVGLVFAAFCIKEERKREKTTLLVKILARRNLPDSLLLLKIKRKKSLEKNRGLSFLEWESRSYT